MLRMITAPGGSSRSGPRTGSLRVLLVLAAEEHRSGRPGIAPQLAKGRGLNLLKESFSDVLGPL